MSKGDQSSHRDSRPDKQRDPDQGGLAERLEREIDAFLATRDVTHLDMGIATAGPYGAISDPVVLNLLNVAFLRRWEERGGSADLDQAIECGKRAVDLAVTDIEQAKYLSNLGLSLSERWQTGRSEDLERAISCIRQALSLGVIGVDRAKCLHNLGRVLFLNWQLLGVPRDLEEAVEAAQEALVLVPSSPERALYLNNLSMLLSYRWQVIGTGDDLERAIDCAREAIDLAPNDRNRAWYLSNLSNRLALRWQLKGGAIDLASAVEFAREAVDLTPTGPYRATLLNNLGIVLTYQWQLTGSDDDLDAAIACAQEAVDLTPTGPGRAARLNNLGNRLAYRWEARGQSEDLDEAIDLSRQALTLTPTGPDRAKVVSNLGARLGKRWLAARRRDDLQEAIRCSREAVSLTPSGIERPARLASLGSALVENWRVTQHHGDLQEAMLVLREATVGGKEGPLEAALRAGGELARLAVEAARWEDAAAAAATAIDIAQAAVGRSGATESGEHWLSLVQGVAALGVYALVKLGRLHDGAMLAERGLAVLVAEQLGLDRAERDGHAALSAAYREAAGRVDRAVAAAREAGDGRRPAHTQDPVVVALRALERARHELESVIGPLVPEPAVADVMAVARELGRPVVWLLATAVGGLALVAEPGGEWREVWLERLTEETVKSWAGRLTIASRQRGTQREPAFAREISGARGVRGVGSVRAEAPQVVAQLAEGLAPLGTAPGWCVVPVGPLAQMPIGAVLAVGDQPRPVSVAASARVQGLALAGAEANRGREVLAVTNPVPCTLEAGPIAPLPNAAAEGRTLQDLYGAKHLTGSDATVAGVARALGRPWRAVHIATHGLAVPERPLDSFALLADEPDGRAGRLSARELATALAVARGARLVFLACCWLGMPGSRLPDETQGFPTALLQVGVGAVVASLWPVEDGACRHLVESFYRHWLTEGNEPALALAKAQVDSRARHPQATAWAAFLLTGS
jgi:tetratricopeptide (TPR) repeat protein